MKSANCKNGISLIAVLMFMLAATTASIVVFKWIGSENFSSAARLKNNEAYQASRAGLEAVQGWLTNKGADAGALIRDFEIKNGNLNPPSPHTPPNPPKLIFLNFLGDMESNKQQKYKVYLTGVSTANQPYKLKFLSVGEARDGSKYSQAAIFDVDGLYKMEVKSPPAVEPGNLSPVPPFFGGVGKSTQQTLAGAHVIGNLDATAGLSTTGDLIVTGNYTMASGLKVGCPIINNNPDQQLQLYTTRPANYDNLVKNKVFGNGYVKEDLDAQQSTYCGSLYVGGNMIVKGETEIWGDLYVEGNLSLGTSKLTVYGNATIKGNISTTASNPTTFRKNLVLPKTGSTYNCYSTITVNGTTCKVGTPLPSSCVSSFNAANDCNSATGGDLLTYLGSQITNDKLDQNGNKCTSGTDCMYRIPDPIVLGGAEAWKNFSISESTASKCDDLKSLPSETSVFDGKSIVKVETGFEINNFVEAVNKCYTECSSPGNSCKLWGGTDNTKWLVVRVSWNGGNYNAPKKQLDGKIIIVVENKPGSSGISPPLTTSNTNILLYLRQGAETIYLRPSSGEYMNYFIYSDEDIEKITGNQNLKGYLFMKNGKKVKEMYDFKIQENKPILDALGNAGIIVEPGKSVPNPDVTRPEIPMPSNLDPYLNPTYSYIPTVPHLKVAIQSVNASRENPTNYDNARPAILVMPRVIYLKPNQLPVKKELFKVLYLNGATTGSITDNDIKNCPATSDKEKGYICNLDLRTKCGNSNNELCNNAFYVIVGDN